MSTNARNQPRQPKGVPAGGRWRATARAEGSVALAADPEPQPVSFANMDRAERLRAMHAEVEAATAQLSGPAKWREFLDAQARFHRYSWHNTLLILSQRPDATKVAGLHDWADNFGRSVKKGEKAIWVLAPTRYRKVTVADDGTEETEERLFFRPVPVFDVSQTEGPPLPEPPSIEASDTRTEAPPGMAEALSGWVRARGFDPRRAELPGALYGRTDFSARTVEVNASHNGAQQALTLAHEAAHIALGHDACYGKSRPEREIEAESVAYIVGRHFGLADAGSFNYVANWAHGDPEAVRKTAGRVVSAAKQVLDEVDRTEERRWGPSTSLRSPHLVVDGRWLWKARTWRVLRRPWTEPSASTATRLAGSLGPSGRR